MEHGYVRKRNGTFITFDVPGAAGTEPGTINVWGAIVGDYFDPSGVYHGFLRQPDGNLITFDVPGAGIDPGEGTWPYCISIWGQRPDTTLTVMASITDSCAPINLGPAHF